MHDTSSRSSSTPKAESRQDFDFDDHDFTFHDDHGFDLDHEPTWYYMTGEQEEEEEKEEEEGEEAKW